MKIAFLKNKKGILSLLIGLLCLIGSFLVYKFVTKDEILLFILATFSIVIIVYSLFQIVRDSLQ